MKKFVHICLIILAISVPLTACEKNQDMDITGVPSETTSLTLTVSLTETEPPPPEPVKNIELAVFDPFADEVKIDNSAKRELMEFASGLETARRLMRADWYIYDSEEFTDLETVLEGDETVLDGFVYKPFINTEIAQTEEELFNYIRKYFTANYISDETLREYLFTGKNSLYGSPPYKTVDGRLCVRCGYDGVMTWIDTDDLWTMAYSESEAEVVLYAHGVDYPPYHAYLGLKKSEEYGWRLDSLEFKGYDERFIGIYNAAFIDKLDTVNKILDGGNVPENAAEFTENGIKYVQTDLDMTVAEMKEFFEETFRPMTIPEKTRKKLLVPYTEKYIDGVFAERDGVLYRKADEPRRYVPEPQLDLYAEPSSASSGTVAGSYVVPQVFFDSETEERFSKDVSVYYTYIDKVGEADFEPQYTGFYIASELPIRESGETAAHYKEVIKPVVEGKLEELNLSDAPHGVTHVCSGNMFDFNGDGYDDYVLGYGLYSQFQLVIIDSQNGAILLDERIMTTLSEYGTLEVLANNSQYAFKISERVENPAENIIETVHLVKDGENRVFEAVYDAETGDFSHAYNVYTREEYFREQEEFLDGYEHFADVEWSLYRQENIAQSLE